MDDSVHDSPTDNGGDLREALKVTASCLSQGDVAFALGGGYAAWARGGPEPDHDVDFFVVPADIERAQSLLAQRGLRVEQPADDWLFKVFVGDAMVDVIHHLGGDPVPAELLAGAEVFEVLSLPMPILSATDLIRHKLRALNEHECDFARLLPVARALREQVVWAEVFESSSGNPYAAAFLMLLQRLEIVADR